MKIFISWSGDRTKQLALALRDWVKTILQATEPWVSTRDIDGGSVWFNKITGQLKDAPVGIFCITPGNMREPWLVFEAGAIAKGNDANRVCTLLIGLNHTEVEGPLSNFHHTVLSKEGLHKLISGFNKQLPQPLEDKHLEQLFDALWPTIEPAVKAALQTGTDGPTRKTRSADDMIAEVLELTRAISRRIGKLELDAFTASFSPSDISRYYYNKDLPQNLKAVAGDDVFMPSLWITDPTEAHCLALLKQGIKKEEILKSLERVRVDPDIALKAYTAALAKLTAPRE